MPGIGAYDAQNALALDNLALDAPFFDRCPYLHDLTFLPKSIIKSFALQFITCDGRQYVPSTGRTLIFRLSHGHREES